MNTVILSDEQRKRIIEYAKPTKFFSTYQNMNLISAVCDDNQTKYLAIIDFLSEHVRRTGDDYDNYTFVLLTNSGEYGISVIIYYDSTIKITNRLPDGVTEQELIEMIQFYKKM